MSGKNRTLKLRKGANRFKVQDPHGEELGGFTIYVEANRVLIELDQETRRNRGGTDFMMWTTEGNFI